MAFSSLGPAHRSPGDKQRREPTGIKGPVFVRPLVMAPNQQKEHLGDSNGIHNTAAAHSDEAASYGYREHRREPAIGVPERTVSKSFA